MGGVTRKHARASGRNAAAGPRTVRERTQDKVIADRARAIGFINRGGTLALERTRAPLPVPLAKANALITPSDGQNPDARGTDAWIQQFQGRLEGLFSSQAPTRCAVVVRESTDAHAAACVRNAQYFSALTGAQVRHCATVDGPTPALVAAQNEAQGACQKAREALAAAATPEALDASLAALAQAEAARMALRVASAARWGVQEAEATGLRVAASSLSLGASVFDATQDALEVILGTPPDSPVRRLLAERLRDARAVVGPPGPWFPSADFASADPTLALTMGFKPWAQDYDNSDEGALKRELNGLVARSIVAGARSPSELLLQAQAALADALNAADQAGHVVCIAVGNDHDFRPAWPSADRDLWTLGDGLAARTLREKLVFVGAAALDEHGMAQALQPYSSFGPVTLCAPVSTASVEPTDDPLARFSGTSSATPMVASVIGAMVQANPSLTPPEIRAILRSPGLQEPMPGGGVVGAGLIQPVQCVRAARGELRENDDQADFSSYNLVAAYHKRLGGG